MALSTSRTMAEYALSTDVRVTTSSNASAAFAVPLRISPPGRTATGSGSPVSAEVSMTASAPSDITPSAGTTSPARTTTTSPGTTSSTLTSSTSAPRRRCAIRGARSTRRRSSRRARALADASRALPPASMRETITAVRYSPRTRAAAIARSAIASTPTSRRARLRATDQTSGPRTTTAALAQTTSAGVSAPRIWSTEPVMSPTKTPSTIANSIVN